MSFPFDLRGHRTLQTELCVMFSVIIDQLQFTEHVCELRWWKENLETAVQERHHVLGEGTAELNE